MEEQKTEKEILIEKINKLSRDIEECRRHKKNCTQLRKQLTQLIIELDNFRKKERYED